MPWGDLNYIEGRTAPVPWTGCWIWLGELGADGYAKVRRTSDSKWIRVHRLAYELVNGEIPDGLNVLHRCHVRCCVNPGHLYAGTQKENMRDMVMAGRQSSGPSVQEFCRRGHQLTIENRVPPRLNTCRVCHNARQAIYRERRHALV